MSLKLEEISGGARVLQLWQGFKAKRADSKTFDQVEFATQMCDFVYRAMEALEHGHEVSPPSTPIPAKPSWLRSLPSIGTVEHQKRQMFGRGWSIEKIEATNPAYYDRVLTLGWTEENIRRDQEALRAETEVKKRRWPRLFK